MPELNVQISPINEAILKVICYFDFFNHPLTAGEIEKNVSISSSLINLIPHLNELTNEGLICKQDEYYFLYSNNKSIVNERVKKEALAKKVMKKALFFSRLIGAFPFVEGVCISGSLSKGVLEEDGDVDYFIITKPGRLWICRSFLIMFKKIFLFNSHKYFCTNYFVDTEHMSIPDENIFTATEVSHLLPVVNYKTYEKFMTTNSWIKEYLPKMNLREDKNCRPYSKNRLKRLVEYLLGKSVGERLDNMFFRITLMRWKKKFPHFSESDFNLNLRTRKNVSKHHPRGYQQKVLAGHNQRLEMIADLLRTKMTSVA